MVMKYYIFLLALVLLYKISFSQERKIVTHNLAGNDRMEIYKDPERTVTVLVKGNIETIKKITAANGGAFRFSQGNIASIKIKLKFVSQFLKNPAINQIEIANSHYQPLNDKMILANRTNVISLEDNSCLGYNLFGTGVVVGMIDDGIDYHVRDFQNADSTTRIKYLWDQVFRDSVPHPYGFNYGRQWRASDINAAIFHTGICYSFEDANSHGTIDAGIAAGDGRSEEH